MGEHRVIQSARHQLTHCRELYSAPVLQPLGIASSAPQSLSPRVSTCPACNHQHERIYTAPIVCYNEDCSSFFMASRRKSQRSVQDTAEPSGPPSLQDASGTRADFASLQYDPDFLRPTSDPTWLSLVPSSLLPKSIQAPGTAEHATSNEHSKEAWRGFHCRACGRLNSRSEWTRFTCATCGASTQAIARLWHATELQSGPRMPPIAQLGIICTSIQAYQMEGYTIELGDDARVHHLWPAEHDKSGLQASDRLFAEYQGSAAGQLFKRNPLSRHRCG